jgi:hypothetical protein
MGTFDSVYLNKLNKLQEENEKLKTALRMIVEANPPIDPSEIPGLAPYELDDVFPGYESPFGNPPAGLRPPQRPMGNPAGIPFWKWVRQLGNPINYQQWQDWVDQWSRSNPNTPFGNKPQRYRDFLDAMDELDFDRQQRELWRDYERLPVRPSPGFPKPPTWGGRLWKAIKPLITQGPTQNNPTQTTASGAQGGNSQPDVM